MSPDAADALMSCFEAIEQDLERAQDASAAEAVQWFQWEVLKARVQGTVSRETAMRLIEDAQVLCEDLWAREREAGSKNPSTGE